MALENETDQNREGLGDPARQAALLVEQERCSHGDHQEQFACFADFLSAYLRHVQLPLTPEQGAHILILMKLSRAVVGEKNPDNYVDIAGYACIASAL